MSKEVKKKPVSKKNDVEVKVKKIDLDEVKNKIKRLHLLRKKLLLKVNMFLKK